MSKEIQFLLYSLPDEEGKVQVVIKDETLWCTQKAMAQLFGVQRPAITKHLGNIFKEGELDEKVVCSILELTTEHGAIVGKTRTIADIHGQHGELYYHTDNHGYPRTTRRMILSHGQSRMSTDDTENDIITRTITDVH